MSAIATQPESEVLDEEDEGVSDFGAFLNFIHRFGTAPAWMVSLGVHLLALMMLSMIVYYPPKALFQMSLTTDLIDPNVEPVIMDNVQVDTIGTGADVPLSGASLAAASNRSENVQEEVDRKISEEVSPIQVGVSDDVQEVAQGDLVQKVNKSGAAATENTGGTQGAIDRLTFELLASLRERKTLVVWMFDASLSMQSRREMIADRFENVYRQLEALDGASSKHLKTAVVTFGEKTQILTPEAVDGIQTLVPMVRKIKNDESGKENTFSTVVQVGKKFQNYAATSNRKMILVIVTDEKGDDAPQYLDEAITLLRRGGTRCFVVGNASPFGKEKGLVRLTLSAEEGGGTDDYLVDQGPESIYPDSLQLPFFGVNSNGLEFMSAGYGPYALTRLCSETGGVFLIAEDGNTKHYDPHIMRNYQPDYRPFRTVEQDVRKNKAKYALVEAAKGTVGGAINMPRLSFPANNDNELREAISEAQKPLSDLDYKINLILSTLEAGEKDREKILEPRWQAAYDLAIGRALAMRARTLGYNTILAEMKLNPKPFTKKGNNVWNLKLAKEVNAVPDVKKKASRAATYLKRVIDQHPDTPWAELAERELSEPMGWEWTEGADENGRLAMASPEEKKAILLLAEDQKKKQAMRQQKEAQRPKKKL